MNTKFQFQFNNAATPSYPALNATNFDSLESFLSNFEFTANEDSTYKEIKDAVSAFEKHYNLRSKYTYGKNGGQCGKNFFKLIFGFCKNSYNSDLDNLKFSEILEFVEKGEKFRASDDNTDSTDNAGEKKLKKVSERQINYEDKIVKSANAILSAYYELCSLACVTPFEQLFKDSDILITLQNLVNEIDTIATEVKQQRKIDLAFGKYLKKLSNDNEKGYNNVISYLKTKYSNKAIKGMEKGNYTEIDSIDKELCAIIDFENCEIQQTDLITFLRDGNFQDFMAFLDKA